MKKRTKIILLSVGAVVLVGLVLFGISWSKRGVVAVQTAKVGRQDIASIVTASGQIKPPPEDLANVNANSMGKIVELLVHEGDSVKKGQLLLRTEDVQQSADVDAMAAGLKNAQADVSGSDSAVQSAAAAMKTAQADYEQAQAKLKQTKDDYARGEQLFKDKLIAQRL
jgi:HlyD family secretion protein